MAAILLLSCILGIVPMAVYTLILWMFDRYEKEPLGLLLAAFAWGFLPSAIIAIISQFILDVPATAVFGQNAFAQALVEASLIAPITEEGIKGLGVLLIFFIFHREFDSVFDGILYGGLVGFGFAAIENVLYLLDSGSVGGVLALAFVRAFIFGLNHAFFTSLTGIGLALARYQRQTSKALLFGTLGFVAAVTAHSLHNFGATIAAEASALGLLFSWLADSAGILFVFVVILVALRREGKWISDHLEGEVRQGTLTEAQWHTARSAPSRLGAAWGALLSGDLGRWRRTRRFYQQCAELAFKLHQLQCMGDESGNQQIVDRLRGEVGELSRAL
jgi:protease PrsW